MTRAVVLEKVAAAKQAISDAESDLRKVVGEIVIATRAEKKSIRRPVPLPSMSEPRTSLRLPRRELNAEASPPSTT